MTNQYLASLDLAGFRSFAREQRLVFTAGAGLNLLIGGNGFGKSTALEAVEWALCGSVERLGGDGASLSHLETESGIKLHPSVRLQFSNECIVRGPDSDDRPVFGSLPNIKFKANFPQLFRFTHRSSQAATLRLQHLDAKKRWLQIESTQSLRELAGALQAIDQRFVTEQINARSDEIGRRLAILDGISNEVSYLEKRLATSSTLAGLPVHLFEGKVDDLISSMSLSDFIQDHRASLVAPEPAAAVALLNGLIAERTNTQAALRSRESLVLRLKQAISDMRNLVRELEDQILQVHSAEVSKEARRVKRESLAQLRTFSNRIEYLEAAVISAAVQFNLGPDALRKKLDLADDGETIHSALLQRMYDELATLKVEASSVVNEQSENQFALEVQRARIEHSRIRQKKVEAALSVLAPLVLDADLQCPVCKTHFEHQGELVSRLNSSFSVDDAQALAEFKSLKAQELLLQERVAVSLAEQRKAEELLSTLIELIDARHQFREGSGMVRLDRSSREHWLSSQIDPGVEATLVGGKDGLDLDSVAPRELLELRLRDSRVTLASLESQLRIASEINGVEFDGLDSFVSGTEQLTRFFHRFSALAEARVTDQLNQENEQYRRRLEEIAREYRCEPHALVENIRAVRDTASKELARIDRFREERDVARGRLREVLTERQALISHPIEVAMNWIQRMMLSKRGVVTRLRPITSRGSSKLELVTSVGSSEVASTSFRSEGEQAADHLCYLIAVSLAFGHWCKWPALILDDPLQFNDIVHTSGYADLVRRLIVERGYQLFHATHDLDQARYLAQKCLSAGIPVRQINFMGLDGGGPIIEQGEVGKWGG